MNKKIFNRIISLLAAFAFVISLPLYSFAIVGGTTNEYSFTMEDVVNACKNNDIKRLNEMAEELMPKEETEEPAMVPLWSSDYSGKSEEDMCHEYITIVGCFWYVGAVAEKGYNVNINGITVDDIRLLAKYLAYPDTIGWLAGYAGHFYDPTTEANYLNSSSNTAKTNFVKYYSNAKKDYNASTPESSFKELGKALHFIQDVNEPHHAANVIAGISTHSDFEKYVSIHRDRLLEKMEESNVAVTVDESMLNKEPGAILHEAALVGRVHISIAIMSKKDPDMTVIDNMWDRAAKNTLQYSIYDTASVIYKFFKEQGRI